MATVTKSLDGHLLTRKNLHAQNTTYWGLWSHLYSPYSKFDIRNSCFRLLNVVPAKQIGQT